MNRIDRKPVVLDVIALLADRPREGFSSGQVGTVVELLDERTAMVEFSEDQGRAFVIAPCGISELIVLRCVPEAA